MGRGLYQVLERRIMVVRQRRSHEVAAEEQDERYEEGVWGNPIQSWLEDPVPKRQLCGDPIELWDSDQSKVTVTDILLHCIAKDVAHHTNGDRMQVVRCLRHLGWIRKQEGKGARRGKLVLLPPGLDRNGGAQMTKDNSFSTFVDAVRASCSEHAKAKGYTHQDVDGESTLTVVMQKIGIHREHCIGEIVTKCLEYRKNPRRVLLEKIAGWSFQLWKETEQP